MPELVRVEQDAWALVSQSTGASFRGTTLVRGPGARQVGEAMLGLGSSTVIAEESPFDPDHADPPDDAVDTVVLLHAWDGPGKVDGAAKAAVEWLKPGGWLLMADLDPGQLRSARPELYPSALLYQMFPDVLGYLESRSTNSVGLSTAAIRAGLDGKSTMWFDRPVGVYASPSEQQAAVEFGVWRGLELLDPDSYGELLTAVGAIPIEGWPLIEVEPWVLAAGSARV